MGLQDRDWYHEAIKEKNKKNQLKYNPNHEFKKLLNKKESKSLTRPLLIWSSVAIVLFFIFKIILKIKGIS